MLKYVINHAENPDTFMACDGFLLDASLKELFLSLEAAHGLKPLEWLDDVQPALFRATDRNEELRAYIRAHGTPAQDGLPPFVECWSIAESDIRPYLDRVVSDIIEANQARG